MVAYARNLVKLAVEIRGAKNVIFTLHLFERKLCFVKPACRTPVKVSGNQRIKSVARKSLLREQNFTARAFANAVQYFKIFFEPLFVHDVNGRRQLIKTQIN